MQRLIFATCFILLPLLAHASKPPKMTSTQAASRAYELARNRACFLHDIPPSPRRDEPVLARDLARSMMWYHDMNRQCAKDDVPIVFSDDPAQAARVARVAFASLREGSLRGLCVICGVGKQYDGYLRSVASISGVTLEVEALPK
jgi:hypothetical protein